MQLTTFDDDMDTGAMTGAGVEDAPISARELAGLAVYLVGRLGSRVRGAARLAARRR